MNATKILPVGTRVQARGRNLFGTVIGLDSEHYLATQGATVYAIRWDRIGYGGGWCDYDLVAA